LVGLASPWCAQWRSSAFAACRLTSCEAKSEHAQKAYKTQLVTLRRSNSLKPVVTGPRKSSGYWCAQFSDSDWEADVLPSDLPRRLGWRLRFAQAGGLCVDTHSQDCSCTLFQAPIERHPQIRESHLTQVWLSIKVRVPGF
jgi:hypothetical protein